MSADAESQNVKVCVRVRPFNSREIAEVEGGIDNVKTVVLCEGTTVRVLDPERSFQEREAFEFDYAFWSIPESQGQYSPNPFTSQEAMFEACGRPVVENALRGYHNTLFAYGQTGSGKTHTMLGVDDDEGIAPRLVRNLFARIAEEKARHPEEKMIFAVELSFLEIYNEKVKDLLSIANASPKTKSNQGHTEYAECRVRFHPEKGTFVEGLIRLNIASEEECLASIKSGMEHRAVTSTLMNDTSSRSHAIFQICVSQKAPLKGTTRVSIINLVDLAGSERIKMSGVTGQALLEAKNINLSLSTLRRVIDVLIDNSRLKKGQRAAVPPYRESLLTWVLSDSLGGNSKTMMIAAVSPAGRNIEDTMGTLRYALKAKAIVCNARVNEEKTAAVVNALRGEMEQLRRQLEERAGADAAEQERLRDSLREREEEFAKMQDEARRLDEIKHQYEEELTQKESELQRAQQQILSLENIEEEKQRKEEELRKARELQEATAAMLQRQEEERRRKDEELQRIIERKTALKKHHDRAAEEEAKARFAAEQARLRQFATAFQNAFVLGKQKSGLDELRSEHQWLEERVELVEKEVQERDAQLREMTTKKSMLQRQVELLDARCQAMQRDLNDVLHSKNEKIAELTARKAEADEALFRQQQELMRKRAELEQLRKLFSEGQEQQELRLQQMQLEQESLSGDLQHKEERLAKLRELLSEGQGRLEGLQSSSEEYRAQIAQLAEENRARNERLAELRQRKATLVAQRDEARTALEVRRAELDRMRAKLTEVNAKATTLRQNHHELKQYVSSKFFPVAGGAAASNNRSGSSAAPMTHNGSPMMTSANRGRSPSLGNAGGLSGRTTPRRSAGGVSSGPHHADPFGRSRSRSRSPAPGAGVGGEAPAFAADGGRTFLPRGGVLYTPGGTGGGAVQLRASSSNGRSRQGSKSPSPR